MERISTIKGIALSLLAGICLIGCNGDAAVSADEEAKFKNPNKDIDYSKIPKDSKPKGPAFIGEPSGATSGGVGGGAAPPPGASTG